MLLVNPSLAPINVREHCPPVVGCKFQVQPKIIQVNGLLLSTIKSETEATGLKYRTKEFSSFAAELKLLCKKGRLNAAVLILESMEQQGLQVDVSCYTSILVVCSKTKSLYKGRQVHACFVKAKLNPSILISNVLIDMYSKCNCILDAKQIFETMPERDVISWNIIILGYARDGDVKEAMKAFGQMVDDGLKPNGVTYVNVLSACIGSLELCKYVHSQFLNSGIDDEIFVESILVSIYSKCGAVERARHVFDRIANKNIVSWTSMISGYAHNGHGKDAFNLFVKMIWHGLRPNETTYASLLGACADMDDLQLGKYVHAHLTRYGLDSDLFIQNTLVNMYIKCGSLEDAQQVFNRMHSSDVVSWTSLIAGLVQHANGREAFRLFIEMEEQGLQADKVTYISLLNACSSLGLLGGGKWVHAHIMRTETEFNVFVGSALINMYAKCLSISDACQLFQMMQKHNVVSWTSMVTGYVDNGANMEAIDLFRKMLQQDLKPDNVTHASILIACGNIGALEYSKHINLHLQKSVPALDASVNNTLIDTYSRCGSMEDAFLVFKSMAVKDRVSWNVIVSAYAEHGDGKTALELCQEMERESFKPDNVTFTSVLAACSHVRLADEGHFYFVCMSQTYELSPIAEHYACIVDLLGRAGYLNEAQDFIVTMPFSPCFVNWTTFFGSCRNYYDTRLAEYAMEEALVAPTYN